VDPKPERRDRVDAIIDQWSRERPDLDPEPMEVLGRISRVAGLLSPRIHDGHRPFGLTREAFDVLATLRRSGPPYRLTPTELYRWLMLSSGAMTNRIDRLEVDGLVERVDDPRDRRGCLVGLTERGRDVIDRALDAHVTNELALLEPLSAEERKCLGTFLRKLLLSLE
jgi:DNA-binding MarR family transcriptional regulator